MKEYYSSLYDLENLIKYNLFIICPNNSGSTFLKNVLATSKKTWNLKREGQHIFGFSGPCTHTCAPLIWGSNVNWLQTLKDPSLYNWDQNRNAWYFQSFSKSSVAPIFITKSPPFLLIVEQLRTHFKNARFIFMVRNPYAVVEGILRRHQTYPRQDVLEWATKHILTCFEYQKYNIEYFSNSVFFTYEFMCKNPIETEKKIQQLIPDLDDVILQQKIPVKGMYNEVLRDMNNEQIAQLNGTDITKINEFFEQKRELLHYFGYELL